MNWCIFPRCCFALCCLFVLSSQLFLSDFMTIELNLRFLCGNSGMCVCVNVLVMHTYTMILHSLRKFLLFLFGSLNHFLSLISSFLFMLSLIFFISIFLFLALLALSFTHTHEQTFREDTHLQCVRVCQNVAVCLSIILILILFCTTMRNKHTD